MPTSANTTRDQVNTTADANGNKRNALDRNKYVSQRDLKKLDTSDQGANDPVKKAKIRSK